MRLLLCFSFFICMCSQAHDISTRASSDILRSISRASADAVINASADGSAPEAPAKFLDDERFRVFAASDLSQNEIDTTLQYSNDAYELWMGPPYYGKSQAKAIYIMITGNDWMRGQLQIANIATISQTRAFRQRHGNLILHYLRRGRCWDKPPGHSTVLFMVMAAGKDPVSSDSYKRMTYHEVFHIYQMSNVFTNSDEEYESAMGRLSGDDPTELVAWWMEGQADFFSALYRDEDGFKDAMRWALEGTGPFSVSRKENFLRKGLRNISWDQGLGRSGVPVGELVYRLFNKSTRRSGYL